MSERPDLSRLTSDEKDTLIGALLDQVEALGAEVTALRAETAELKRRLGMNSSNSGKPPSSDGYKKKPQLTNLREKTGKKSGGQAGKLARWRPPPSEHQKRGLSYDSARPEPSSPFPTKTRRSLAPDNRRFRPLRLRASGLQRLATAPHSR